jgi:hypothetical protein
MEHTASVFWSYKSACSELSARFWLTTILSLNKSDRSYSSVKVKPMLETACSSEMWLCTYKTVRCPNWIEAHTHTGHRPVRTQKWSVRTVAMRRSAPHRTRSCFGPMFCSIQFESLVAHRLFLLSLCGIPQALQANPPWYFELGRASFLHSPLQRPALLIRRHMIRHVS